MNKKYSVEWSESQKCFHIDSFLSAIKRNMEAFFEGRENDWVCHGIFDTSDLAHKYINELKEVREISSLSDRIPTLK